MSTGGADIAGADESDFLSHCSSCPTSSRWSATASPSPITSSPTRFGARRARRSSLASSPTTPRIQPRIEPMPRRLWQLRRRHPQRCLLTLSASHRHPPHSSTANRSWRCLLIVTDFHHGLLGFLKATRLPAERLSAIACNPRGRLADGELWSVGRLIRHARYCSLLLGESRLTRRLFAGMLGKIAASPAPTGFFLLAVTFKSGGPGAAGEELSMELGRWCAEPRCERGWNREIGRLHGAARSTPGKRPDCLHYKAELWCVGVEPRHQKGNSG